MTDSTPLTDRPLALVTGASSGIGYELAKQFADNGFDLVVNAEDTGLAAAAQQLRGAGGAGVQEVQADLRTAEGVNAVWAAVGATGRPLAAAALNAGVGQGGAFLDIDIADEQEIIDTNVSSTVRLAKLVLRDMAGRGEGRVLFTSSIASTMPGTFQAVYNASKSFVQSFAEALQEELKDSGVTITSLMPGPTGTDFFHRADMDDTKVGSSSKDSAAQVAEQGFTALMKGEKKLVAGGLGTKAQGLAAKVLPDSVKGVLHRDMAEPGSAGSQWGKGHQVRALTYHGKRDVRVDTVPDPTIQDPTDVIVEVTSTGICGSDLHLYELFGPFLGEGDILGHEPMGVIAEVGPQVTAVKVGDRVVVPFNVSCGTCFMCDQGLHSQCETTQVHEYGTGASLFGYTKLYGQVPGGQAEYLRVPFGNTLPIKVPEGPPDDRFVFLSDVLPTAWQAVQYADAPRGGSLVVLGLGPIGDMCTRVARHLGVENVIGIDLVPERLERARKNDVQTIDLRQHGKDLGDVVRGLTGGRGPDSVIDAVGMEAHGSPVGAAAHKLVGLLPDAIANPLMRHAGVDRLNALYTAIDLVRRGGTISLSGVYGGSADPMPLFQLFDKQVQLRMGQGNVHRWVPEIWPLLVDGDPLGVDDFATHHLPLSAAPEAYATFQKKQDGMVKVLLQPRTG